MRVKVIWFDLESQKGFDIIDNAKNEDDAVRQAHEKHNGKPPAQLFSTIILD